MHSHHNTFDRISLHHWDELLGQWAIQKLKNGEMKILDIATPMFERTLITAALQQTRGRKRHAAELLGWGRNTPDSKSERARHGHVRDDDEEEKCEEQSLFLPSIKKRQGRFFIIVFSPSKYLRSKTHITKISLSPQDQI